MRFGNAVARATFVPMPEAAMNEHRYAFSAKNNVGLTGQFLVMQPITKAGIPQETPHSHLGGSVFPFDGPHDTGPFRINQWCRHQ
jgi:hypothetical protein